MVKRHCCSEACPIWPCLAHTLTQIRLGWCSCGLYSSDSRCPHSSSVSWIASSTFDRCNTYKQRTDRLTAGHANCNCNRRTSPQAEYTKQLKGTSFPLSLIISPPLGRSICSTQLITSLDKTSAVVGGSARTLSTYSCISPRTTLPKRLRD